MPYAGAGSNTAQVGESVEWDDAMSTLGAKQLSDIFRLADVEGVYGVVGDRLNPSIDAIRPAEGIERGSCGR
jgi:hypothetical protein